MSDREFVRRALRALGRLERRRVRARVAWGIVAGAGVAFAALVAWEAFVGGGVRGVGYGVLVGVALGGLAGAVRAWRREAPGVRGMAGAVERAFPQARGVVRDALEEAPGALGEARREAGRAWVERRGIERLDRAVGEDERRRAARWRRGAVAAIALCGAAALVQPAAARRVAEAVRDPASLWRPGTWRVEPGNATVEFGDGLEGRARYAGTGREEALRLEWREADGAWRSESLAAGPSGSWRWEGLEAARTYRLRYGAARSPAYRVEVAAPFGVAEARVRGPAGEWEPLAGRILSAGRALEIRGRATRSLAAAAVEVDGREAGTLAVDGAAFAGTVRLPEGTGRLVVTGAGGETAVVGPIVVAGAGRAWAVVLSPAGEVSSLTGSAAWVEARAGAPAGLAGLAWETADGRSGALADPAGARDTTVAAVVPLGAGRAPGDTVRWRVTATPATGAPVATGWRLAVLPAESELRRAAERAREDAERAVDRALDRAEEALEGREIDFDAEAGLRAAADSLARSIDRTLADPGLSAEMARELEAQRDLLDGAAAAELAPRAGLPEDPETSARARAAILEAVRRRVEALERAMAQAAAADSLDRLADRQRDLAAASRAAEPETLESEVAPRQDALGEAAREALEKAAGGETAPDGEAGERGAEDAARRAGEAIDAAGRAVRSGAPRRAAEAQEEAAERMGAAAETAREEAERAAGANAARRAALDRAAGESIFLAGRERELAEDAAGGGDPPDARARQEVVSGGLERSLQALVDGMGGMPAGGDLPRAIADAVHAALYARRAVLDESMDERSRATALDDAADALAGLAKALLLPGGSAGGASGQEGSAGAEGAEGAASRELRSLAEAQRALADALGGAEEAAGGNPEAAAAQREIGERLDALRRALEESGVDPGLVEALARSVEESASRLERGLPGARSRTELRALEGRMRDLGRRVERLREERRAVPAGAFVPAEPGPLPARATAPRLDAGAALEAWRSDLPAAELEAARRYLESLEAAGVRAAGEEAP